MYNTLNTDDTDNQIQGNELATIKSESVSKIQDNEYLTLKPQHNNISGIAEENVYTPLDAKNIDKQDHISLSETITLQSMQQTQDNTYFTLEPQNALSSGEPVGATYANDNNLSGTLKVVQMDIVNNTTGHDYFMLHPQSSPLPIHKFENKMTEPRVETLDHPKKEPDKENHNYFILEPDKTGKQTEILKPSNQQPESDMSGLDPTEIPTAEKLGNHNYVVLEQHSAATSSE